jgi:hypothetical protein
LPERLAERHFLSPYNLRRIFSFFATMNVIRPLLFTAVYMSLCFAQAQTIPDKEDDFFATLTFNGKLPSRILSGRSALFYDYRIKDNELQTIQRSFAATGIDAILAVETEKLLGGYDVSMALSKILLKREVANLVFIQQSQQGFRCVMTGFNGRSTFVNKNQAAWQLSSPSLNELLTQINREALASFKKQNLLINEQPETDLTLSLINGSRIEAFTPDLKADRLAVRLSGNGLSDGLLKELCQQYPFKLEYVSDTVTDAELRAKGFWYSLNCVHAREAQAKNLLGYASVEKNAAPLSQQEVYKFYFKKLEFDNAYLGKQWDAAPTWTQALQNLITNLRKDLNINP